MNQKLLWKNSGRNTSVIFVVVQYGFRHPAQLDQVDPVPSVEAEIGDVHDPGRWRTAVVELLLEHPPPRIV